MTSMSLLMVATLCFLHAVNCWKVKKSVVASLLSSVAFFVHPGLSLASETENYLPRRLYPGTYANYCGPTPEISTADNCRAHGWHGDEPLDEVDSACRLHDQSYCSCEASLTARRGKGKISLLSSLTALRFLSLPVLEAEGVDGEYFSCVNKADRNLLSTGMRIREEQQSVACGLEKSLAWFCDLSGGGTLGAFEKVNLTIFLNSLDADERRRGGTNIVSLSQLEAQRQKDLLEGEKRGLSLPELVQGKVKEDGDQLLMRLNSF